MRSIVERVLYGALSLVGLVICVFFLARLTGTPTDLYLPAEASEQVRQEFSERHGYNDPVIEQFGRYLAEVAQFNFGESLRQQRPAIDIVVEAFPQTLWLALITMTLAIVIAIPAGCLAAWFQGGVIDRGVTLGALAAVAAPNFWVALVGIYVFSVMLGLLPTSGYGTPSHWVLPIAVLLLRPVGVITQVVRGSMSGALLSEYVKTARAKGVPDHRIIFVHVLRNALLPALTVVGDQAAGIIAGAVVIETIFAFPGIGKLLIDSISFRDFSVLQAAVLVTAFTIFLLNILIDLTYFAVDPRTRRQ